MSNAPQPPSGPPPFGKRWHTREDSGLRVDREGRWWHDDELVEHPKIIEAFNVGLSPTDDGRYILRFGNDWAYVQVEDAAYQVTGVDLLPDGRVQLRLTDRTTEVLKPDTLCLDDDVLHCRVKEGKAWARFSRDAQFQLGEATGERDGALVLVEGGRAHPIPPRTR